MSQIPVRLLNLLQETELAKFEVSLTSNPFMDEEFYRPRGQFVELTFDDEKIHFEDDDFDYIVSILSDVINFPREAIRRNSNSYLPLVGGPRIFRSFSEGGFCPSCHNVFFDVLPCRGREGLSSLLSSAVLSEAVSASLLVKAVAIGETISLEVERSAVLEVDTEIYQEELKKRRPSLSRIIMEGTNSQYATKKFFIKGTWNEVDADPLDSCSELKNATIHWAPEFSTEAAWRHEGSGKVGPIESRFNLVTPPEPWEGKCLPVTVQQSRIDPDISSNEIGNRQEGVNLLFNFHECLEERYAEISYEGSLPNPLVPLWSLVHVYDSDGVFGLQDLETVTSPMAARGSELHKFRFTAVGERGKSYIVRIPVQLNIPPSGNYSELIDLGLFVPPGVLRYRKRFFANDFRYEIPVLDTTFTFKAIALGTVHVAALLSMAQRLLAARSIHESRKQVPLGVRIIRGGAALLKAGGRASMVSRLKSILAAKE